MASIQHLREFIRDRLTAAAEDIFSEFEKTIVQYERQRELQDFTWNPVLKLQRTGESDCATGVCLNPERERGRGRANSQQRTGREANGRRPESAKNKLEARVRHTHVQQHHQNTLLYEKRLVIDFYSFKIFPPFVEKSVKVNGKARVTRHTSLMENISFHLPTHAHFSLYSHHFTIKS